MPQSHLIISCSLNPNSKSSVLAKALEAEIGSRGQDVALIDLREIVLPFCDAGACYSDPNVIALKATIEEAGTVTIATPIYNYGVGGATRNLVALTGDSWTGKTVGLVCAAGGRSSYMAVMGIGNSLMLDFRCLIIPRFVYAAGDDFDDSGVSSEGVTTRIAQLADELERVRAALA